MVPWSEGGNKTHKNKQVLCLHCHY
ncbi:MAG: HNH endonuclease [Trichodesmium sp. St16_bin4-tuft]|nr:HNH endonuclease [Trichodesmium sp. MAG_R01]MDE5067767.1 HNH endonuclease [Trichodesmium sp. St4_bin8_1]MDE5071915.1 HNH endonuclease [Trichodesmium sp. St5_bin8]MDE5092058.1 HNH endonuclease [Trichodesmium sp. St18_bin3_1_1]MDE5093534.1 HNH endonuclease [Trichodesmium sp. St11_bin5]MDE5099524.1 HNH endonuclease [Trichodesmium sp. St16_bin4-tuft]MDT9338844.1 HNH endonuclease [Trichodesmium erythraeum 21-75]